MTMRNEMPNHHLSSDLLLGYATGALDPSMALFVAAHISLCDECRAEVKGYEAVGGALLDAMSPEPLDAGAFDRIMAVIDAETDVPSLAGVSSIDLSGSSELDRLPEPVRSVAKKAAQTNEWKSKLKGIKTLDLDVRSDLREDDVTVQLIRLEPGAGSPRHTHGGMEYTLVLTGAFRDGEHRYGPGDVAVASPDLTHRPVAEEGDVCISLAVTTGPLKFTGMLGLAQRVFGA